MVFKDVCVYCSSMGDEGKKEVTIWDKTGEKVCYNCRLDFLDQEFEGKKESYQLPFNEEVIDGLEDLSLY